MVRAEAVIVAVFSACRRRGGPVVWFRISTALPDNFISGITVPIGTLVFPGSSRSGRRAGCHLPAARRASRLDILQAIASELMRLKAAQVRFLDFCSSWP
jgi:hypothetical protein